MWEQEVEDVRRRRIAWGIGIVVAALALGGGWYWYAARQSAPAPEPALHAPPPAPAANAEPQIANPLPAEGAGSAALPALNDSDAVTRDALTGVLGGNLIGQFLVPQNIVRHIVVTVDNLPRRKVAIDLRPVKPTPGQTAISTQGDITTLSDANFARYASLVQAVQGADARALAAVYQRLYPLFQQAYEDLGYPGKYFNDRLVQVIDNLLETPELAGPVQLVQPRVFYEYADADLEARSSGQRLLMRMGPANARIIKAKLREFRAEIAKNK